MERKKEEGRKARIYTRAGGGWRSHAAEIVPRDCTGLARLEEGYSLTSSDQLYSRVPDLESRLIGHGMSW